jgi:hypothetical protein
MTRSGTFWLWVWLAVFAVSLAWGVATVLFWLDSTKNLNLMTIWGLFVAAAAGIQATLTMRKADPKDDF